MVGLIGEVIIMQPIIYGYQEIDNVYMQSFLGVELKIQSPLTLLPTWGNEGNATTLITNAVFGDESEFVKDIFKSVSANIDTLRCKQHHRCHLGIRYDNMTFLLHCYTSCDKENTATPSIYA